MEVVATMLATLVGIIALGRFSTKRNNLIIFIGSAFVGTAFLDGFHAIVTSQCTGSGAMVKVSVPAMVDVRAYSVSASTLSM